MPPQELLALPPITEHTLGRDTQDNIIVPGILVTEQHERGRFRAAFAVALTGVDRKRCDEPPASPRESAAIPITALTEGLRADRSQTLTLAYSSDSDRAAGCRLTWHMLGATLADTAEEARRDARDLWTMISVALDAHWWGLQFDPVADASILLADLGGPFRTELASDSVAVPVRRAGTFGFGRSVERRAEDAVIVSPAHGMSGPAALDAVLRAMVRVAGRLTCAVEIAPVNLDASDRALITRAAAVLISQSDASPVPGVVEALNGWAACPTGIRLAWRVTSDRAVSTGVVAEFERAVYPGRQARSGIGLASNDANLTRTLDLGGCFPQGRVPASLTPSALALVAHGIPLQHQPDGRFSADSGPLLGTVQHGRCTETVRFASADRSRHCYVCGATGTGKSTLLYNLIAQDIEAGEGVCLIDPHGDVFDQVLASIPAHRQDEVIIVDPCDPEYAIGLNFLECPGPNRDQQMNFVSNEFIKIFDRLYDLKTTGGPIFEQYMRSGLLLVMDNKIEGGTLLDVQGLFEDAAYRKRLIECSTNPHVASFWRNIAERSSGETSLASLAPYVTSKLNQFTCNALIRPIIGQSKTTVDLRTAMDQGRILLVKLSTGLLGELDTQLLGMLLLGKIYAAAMGRANMPPADRRPFYIYVDEFQQFTTDTVAFMLSGARKFGLRLTLANQNLSQLLANVGKQNVLDAVLGNCGTLLCFRLGVADADRLDAYTQPELKSRDLQELPDFHAATRLLVRNAPTRPFVISMLPARTAATTGDSHAIVERSRQRYARPIAEVEKAIIDRREGRKEREGREVREVSGVTEPAPKDTPDGPAASDEADNAVPGSWPPSA